ncbi:MAG: hypothetical protein NZ750_02300 [Anaerolineae bacterium]|nr:hypothetical protein [Anaerolineae bacterium]MDW8173489.1 hypothetical protein [Anaerolineae bacterium]
MPEPTPEQQERLEKTALALYYHAAQMHKAGKSDEDIIADLGSKGVQATTAQRMLERLRQSRQNVARKGGQRLMLMGALNLLLGLGLLLGVFGPLANPVVLALAWIAVGLGFGMFARGMVQVIG